MAKNSRPTVKARESAARSAFLEKAKELGIEIEGNRVFVVTSRNVRVECLPVAHVIEAATAKARDEYIKENPEPEIPTRMVDGLPGQTVKVPYTDVTIAADGVPKEDKDKWVAHKVWEAGLSNATGSRVMKALAIIGCVFDMPDDDGWIKDLEYIGIDVPEDERDRRLAYFSQKVVGHRNDGYKLSQGVFAASGFNEALTKAAEDTF